MFAVPPVGPFLFFYSVCTLLGPERCLVEDKPPATPRVRVCVRKRKPTPVFGVGDGRRQTRPREEGVNREPSVLSSCPKLDSLMNPEGGAWICSYIAGTRCIGTWHSSWCFLHQVLPFSLDMMPRCQHAPVFFVSISLLSSYSFSLSALSLFPSIVSLD